MENMKYFTLLSQAPSGQKFDIIISKVETLISKMGDKRNKYNKGLNIYDPLELTQTRRYKLDADKKSARCFVEKVSQVSKK